MSADDNPLNPSHMLSRRSVGGSSSAIRDLLVHAKAPGIISLAGGLPAPSLFPVETISELAPEILRDRDVLQYGLTEGDAGLRSWIQEYHRDLDGQPVAGDELLVVTGSQQGLDLLGRVLLDPDDVVVVSDPDFLGALQSFRQNGARLIGMPVDDHGMRIDILADKLGAGLRPKIVYVVPEFHNPTGTSLTVERLEELASLADQYGFLIAEDNPYGALRYEGTPLQSMVTMTDRVVQLRTMSKVVAPGLRVAWLTGPSWFIDAATVAKQATDLHTSTVSQRIVHELVSHPGWYESHVATLAPHYRKGRDSLIAGLSTHFGEDARFTTPEGGLFLWVELPENIDSTALLPAALEQGVAFVPGPAFAVDRPVPSTLRLSYATASAEELVEGARRLAQAAATLS